MLRAVYPDLVPEKRSGTDPKLANGPEWFELKRGDNLKFKVPGSEEPAKGNSGAWASG